MKLLEHLALAGALALGSILALPSTPAMAQATSYGAIVVQVPSLGAAFTSAPGASSRGATISNLDPGSALLNARLYLPGIGWSTYHAEPGDIITSVNGQPVFGAEGVARLINDALARNPFPPTRVRLGIRDQRSGNDYTIHLQI